MASRGFRPAGRVTGPPSGLAGPRTAASTGQRVPMVTDDRPSATHPRRLDHDQVHPHARSREDPASRAAFRSRASRPTAARRCARLRQPNVSSASPKSRRARQRTSTSTTSGGGPGSSARMSISFRPTWRLRARIVQPPAARRSATSVSAASPSRCPGVRAAVEDRSTRQVWRSPLTCQLAARRRVGVVGTPERLNVVELNPTYPASVRATLQRANRMATKSGSVRPAHRTEKRRRRSPSIRACHAPHPGGRPARSLVGACCARRRAGGGRRASRAGPRSLRRPVVGPGGASVRRAHRSGRPVPTGMGEARTRVAYSPKRRGADADNRTMPPPKAGRIALTASGPRPSPHPPCQWRPSPTVVVAPARRSGSEEARHCG